MRGVVFTELIEFVESALGFEVADKMIEMSHLDNGGSFSQGGNYPFSHMQKLLMSLSEITGKDPQELLYTFGEHLFFILVKMYGKNISEISSALDFIDSVENYVHVEVKKLYMDTDLPTFTTTYKDNKNLTIIYQSEKRLEAFAHGLMTACGKYFNEELVIEYKTINQSPYQVEFILKKS